MVGLLVVVTIYKLKGLAEEFRLTDAEIYEAWRASSQSGAPLSWGLARAVQNRASTPIETWARIEVRNQADLTREINEHFGLPRTESEEEPNGGDHELHSGSDDQAGEDLAS